MTPARAGTTPGRLFTRTFWTDDPRSRGDDTAAIVRFAQGRG